MQDARGHSTVRSKQIQHSRASLNSDSLLLCCKMVSDKAETALSRRACCAKLSSMTSRFTCAESRTSTKVSSPHAPAPAVYKRQQPRAALEAIIPGCLHTLLLPVIRTLLLAGEVDAP
jgi:hypothetical protein